MKSLIIGAGAIIIYIFLKFVLFLSYAFQVLISGFSAFALTTLPTYTQILAIVCIVGYIVANVVSDLPYTHAIR